jgi:hypothetical protein
MVVAHVNLGNPGKLLPIVITAGLQKVYFVMERRFFQRQKNYVTGIGIFASGILQRTMFKRIINLKESKNIRRRQWKEQLLSITLACGTESVSTLIRQEGLLHVQYFFFSM